MNQAGPFNPAFGAESFGLKDLKSISYNLQARVSLRMRCDPARRGDGRERQRPFRRNRDPYRALA